LWLVTMGERRRVKQAGKTVGVPSARAGYRKDSSAGGKREADFRGQGKTIHSEALSRTLAHREGQEEKISHWPNLGLEKERRAP